MQVPKRIENKGGVLLHFTDVQIAALQRLNEIYPHEAGPPSPSESKAALDALGPEVTMLGLKQVPLKRVQRGLWSHQINPLPGFSLKRDLPAGFGLKPISERGGEHVVVNAGREWWRMSVATWPSSRNHAPEMPRSVPIAKTVASGRENNGAGGERHFDREK